MTDTTWFITGADGMLGRALQRVFADRGETFLALGRERLDITDARAVKRVIGAFARGLADGTQGVIVNAAAYTDVEAAEDEADAAYRVNAEGARTLAAAARSRGLRMVQVSTDFVFDGTRGVPYSEADSPNPLSVYGASKLAGEEAVFAEDPEAIIVRTSWVFGSGGTNFPLKILSGAEEGRDLCVVNDQVGSPTYAMDLAVGIARLIDMKAAPGVYHLAGSGRATRHELATETLRIAEIDTRVRRIRSADSPTRAARPLNSMLNCSKAARLGVSMPSWRSGLRRYLGELEHTS